MVCVKTVLIIFLTLHSAFFYNNFGHLAIRSFLPFEGIENDGGKFY